VSTIVLTTGWRPFVRLRTRMNRLPPVNNRSGDRLIDTSNWPDIAWITKGPRKGQTCADWRFGPTRRGTPRANADGGLGQMLLVLPVGTS
jgi:hypothetical protein